MTHPNPAWERDSDKLWYAVRGHAEHELTTNLANAGYEMTPDQIDIARLAISTAAVSAMRILATTGWLRDEPTIAFEDTILNNATKITKARLSAQENPGLS
jgi:hypothetical protein